MWAFVRAMYGFYFTFPHLPANRILFGYSRVLCRFMEMSKLQRVQHREMRNISLSEGRTSWTKFLERIKQFRSRMVMWLLQYNKTTFSSTGSRAIGYEYAIFMIMLQLFWGIPVMRLFVSSGFIARIMNETFRSMADVPQHSWSPLLVRAHFMRPIMAMNSSISVWTLKLNAFRSPFKTGVYLLLHVWD